MLVYLALKFVVDFLMLYHAGMGVNNIWLHNSSVPLRYALLSQVFKNFIESPSIRRWITISVPVYLLLTVVDTYFSNLTSSSLQDQLPVRYMGIVECILMLLWILLYFYEVFKSLRISNLLKSPPFLVAVAWLLYYASLVFYSPLFYYIYRSGSVFQIGFFEAIPDLVEFLAILIVSIAVSMVSEKGYD